jgi:hypothetical protein
MCIGLLTNATVVDDAIRFVSQKSKGKEKSSYNTSADDKGESNWPSYDEESREINITTTTTNEVF